MSHCRDSDIVAAAYDPANSAGHVLLIEHRDGTGYGVACDSLMSALVNIRQRGQPRRGLRDILRRAGLSDYEPAELTLANAQLLDRLTDDDGTIPANVASWVLTKHHDHPVSLAAALTHYGARPL